MSKVAVLGSGSVGQILSEGFLGQKIGSITGSAARSLHAPPSS